MEKFSSYAASEKIDSAVNFVRPKFKKQIYKLSCFSLEMADGRFMDTTNYNAQSKSWRPFSNEKLTKQTNRNFLLLCLLCILFLSITASILSLNWEILLANALCNSYYPQK